jgi:hypothetical protein
MRGSKRFEPFPFELKNLVTGAYARELSSL